MKNAQPKALCLNMIVKNEMANLQRCLDAVAPHVACWVIGDTGSTDGTQDFIRSFFAARNIPGELHSFPFINFAQARNEALDRARASRLHFDYILLTDADMELVVESPTFSQDLTSAAYKVLQRTGVTYWNKRLLRRDVPASYKGVTHEYLDVPAGETRSLEGIRFIDHATGANRVAKFERDARLLIDGIATETDSGMIARYKFYLANTLRDSGQQEAALQVYLERARLGHFQQEVFVSLLNVAKLKEALRYPDEEIIASYVEAITQCPTRAEALHGASRFCRDKGNYERAYQFAAQGLTIARPKEALFVVDWIYDYGLLDELAVNACWTGRYRESVDACDRMLREGKLPAHMRERVQRNRALAVGKLTQDAASSPPEPDVFAKLLRAAREKEKLAAPDEEIISAYAEATAACPARAEALHGAARFCRGRGKHEQGYHFAAQGLAIPYPNNATLVENWIYEYGLLDELAINAYWSERYAESVDACDRLLAGGNLPASHRDRVLKNRTFAVDKLGNIFARSTPVHVSSGQSEAGTPERSSEAPRSGATYTKRTSVPYAVRRAADRCPDISVEKLTRRIGYASYVNVERRYMYYQVSKAGCTSMKWLLHSLEQLPPIRYFSGSQHETRRDMFIHERSNLNIPSLLDLDDATQEFVLTSPQFMRFTVVRSPYTRIESAWKDKVRLCAPTHEQYYQAIRGRPPADDDPVSPISFQEFVDAIAQEDLANCDAHWRLQVAQTLRGALNFSHIGRLEDFSETARILCAHWGEAPLQPPATFNRTVGTSHYNEHIATIIHELYKQDFEAYNYDRDSWVRCSEQRPPVVPEATFVDEVLERNIVIGHLYKERDELKRRARQLEISLRAKEQALGIRQ